MQYKHIGKRPGIYAIRNMINDKVYVGKSKNCFKRIKDHIGRLNMESSDENIHLRRAWKKYGRSFFEVYVLEYLEEDELLLSKRELYWIKELNTLEKGYNLRLDSDSKCIVSDETRKRLSISQRKFRDSMTEEQKQKESDRSRKFWNDNPELKELMREKVSYLHAENTFVQKTLNGEVIKEYRSVYEILKLNPNFKRPTVTNCIWGYKPTAYGYLWEKVKKI